MQITVFGAGAWGTAMAQQAARKHPTLLWGRDSNLMQSLASERMNSRYLPKVTLLDTLKLSSNLREACEFSDQGLWVIGTSMAGLADTVQQSLTASDAKPKAIVWLCKGIRAQPGKAAQLPHEIVCDLLGKLFPPNEDKEAGKAASTAMLVGALTGPSFAAEVAQGQPAALVAASESAACSHMMIEAFHHHQMRVYASDDVIGASLGGALKNIVAIAAGISDGLGLGNNARAALITRGLAEIARLGQALGARPDTFMGLAGLGDLVLTCTGNASRNRQVGLGMAEGKSLADIVASLGHVAEGVPTTEAAVMLAQSKGVELPIAGAVLKVLQGQLSAKDAVRGLIAREAKRESNSPGPDPLEAVA